MTRVLIVGADGRGSWKMRGRQLGEAIGARITLDPTEADWKWAEVVVLVKRAAIFFSPEPLAIPVVWDALDFWEQPADNAQPSTVLIVQAEQIARSARATTVVGATEAMARDLGGVYLPHHCRIGLRPTPPRKQPLVIGYDGSPRYLGGWRKAIEVVCARLGVEFAVNPPDLSQVDALVAFRDGQWDGWACRQWKSGVKYVNAIAAGRPILTQPCAAFDEIQPVGATVDEPAHLEQALRALLDKECRDQAYERGRQRAGDYTLAAVATRYREIIGSALRAAA